MMVKGRCRPNTAVETDTLGHQNKTRSTMSLAGHSIDGVRCLKKFQNAPRPSEHPPVKEMSKRSGGIIDRLQILQNCCYFDVVVVVFFTLTDRASTIPNNTRGCQSGTWSAGQKKIRGTSTKLQ